MSDNKKYYYMKLKENFFDLEEMKIMESMENGILYQNLYLKICLLSIKSEGKLIFKDVIPYDVGMISTITRTNIDIVRSALNVFQKLNLVVIVDNKTIYMTDIQSLIGKSSTEAERIKTYRNKLKSIENVQMYEKCTPELELELELELEKDIKELPAGNESSDSLLLESFKNETALAVASQNPLLKKKPKDDNWYKKSNNAKAFKFVKDGMIQENPEYIFTPKENVMIKNIVNTFQNEGEFDSEKYQDKWEIYTDEKFWLDKGCKNLSGFYNNINRL